MEGHVGSRHEEHTFELTGGRLCLDFANTVDNRPAGSRRERLHTYDDLLAWSRQAGALLDQEVRILKAPAGRHPKKAEAVLRRAIELREAIYGILSAVAGGRSPLATDLNALNRVLHGMFLRSRIAFARGAFSWKLVSVKGKLDRMLWAVADSAVVLMTSRELRLVRECAAENCGWLFIDKSRNRSRRWCDMKVCGNRNKARRFRERH